ncbi:MAG: nodulation protein [Proteobacteria bacterium]|nr:nodulation protein [Pseudomonadota bacterium]
MLVLGWHGGLRSDEATDRTGGYSTHDGAAVLVQDGNIVAGIEEERLNRIKHSNFFPVLSIRFCLQRAGAQLSDVDLIALDAQESVVDEYATFRALVAPEQPLISGREMIARVFEDIFGDDVRHKLRFCRHHLAHIYSALYASGKPHGLAVALDGEGDQRSGMVATFTDSGITPLREYSPAQSLGGFYTTAIAMLGYRRFDEYKVMGLAPYGDPTKFRPLFSSLYSLLPDGQFEFVPDGRLVSLFAEKGLLSQIRRRGEPFTQLHKDLAASLQEAVERVAMHIFEHQSLSTGERTLCYSGGVAHNCTLNGKLLYSGLFDNIFVQPAAHDAGNALGAALAAGADEGMPLRVGNRLNLYLGTDVGTEEVIAERLQAWSGLVRYEHHNDITERAVDLLVDGSVIGWVQGCSEFGPRALGNRSILADPRPPEFKHLINAMVKKREGFRPFAPSVLEEQLHNFFEVPDTCQSLPHMVFVVRVKEKVRELLGAITHVDGTARVQTVSLDDNPKYHALIKAFEDRTGVPILLNTSFNNDVEPIVDSIDDAVVCFLTTDIHHLVIGNHLVSKPKELDLQSMRLLIPGLRAHQKLVRQTLESDRDHHRHSIESTASDFFVKPAIDITSDTFAVLAAADGASTLDAICRAAHGSDEERSGAVVSECAYLWARRAVVLLPT